uniref:Uncharacterized protein n=1 Tax=Neogobius melanostomus TaxID=47308 RepID=A0A8C6UKS3_9GOBI
NRKITGMFATPSVMLWSTLKKAFSCYLKKNLRHCFTNAACQQQQTFCSKIVREHIVNYDRSSLLAQRRCHSSQSHAMGRPASAQCVCDERRASRWWCCRLQPLRQ